MVEAKLAKPQTRLYVEKINGTMIVLFSAFITVISVIGRIKARIILKRKRTWHKTEKDQMHKTSRKIDSGNDEGISSPAPSTLFNKL